MARKFVKIPQSTFDELQVEAGVLLKQFDPENPEVDDSDIVTATTGGIEITCVPSYDDYGSDVDNCPNNTKELKILTGWNCSISTTALGTSVDLIKMTLGAADVTDNKITPRSELIQSDFSDIWWVGDKAKGGFVAVKLFNALSTDGLTLKTTKNGKGTFDFTLTGHVSINALDVVPMEFYSTSAEEEEEEEEP